MQADVVAPDQGPGPRSVEQVEQGTVPVDQAGKTMVETVGSIRPVSDT